MKILGILSFALATTILGQTANPPAAESRESAFEQVRKLSKRERRERIEKLPVRYKDFVADTAPIIFDPELDTFLALQSDAERDAFVNEFWRRRDLMHGGTGRFREVYTERLGIAKEEFRRIESDRARMFLLHGPPAEVVRANCTRVLQPIEIWKYEELPGVGQFVRLIFYRPGGSADYRLWNPLGGSMALAELVVNDRFLGAEAQNPRRNAAPVSESPYAAIARIQMECREGEEVMRAINQMVQLRVDLLRLFEPPQVQQEEDARKLLRSMVIANPNAPKLEAEFGVRYPGRQGSRTDVQMTILVPRSAVEPAEVHEARVYTIDVVGEVLKDDALWEKYRYRFDFPADMTGDQLPLVINRFLRPSEYVSRVKVVDANGGAETVIESALSVPEVFEAPAAAESVTVASAPAPAAPVADPKLPTLRIIPPSDGIVNGIQTVETLISGDEIKGVEFWLDGRKLAVRRSPPFALDFDFGEVPRVRHIRAIALDAKGNAITGDDIHVNRGTDPFGVRIVSPRIAPHLAGQARVEMEVRVPEGEELESLELYWNETRLATLYDAPFVQIIDVPKTNGGVGYIRAVARLAGGSMPPVEDVVMINTPAYMEELDVHLVELPTTVLIDGKPADHLTEKAFKVLDEGQPVRIAKFDHVRNLPLSIGLAIDSSGSMARRMEEAQKAGGEFFEKVMRKGDKAFLLSFDKDVRLVQKWTTKVTDLHAGLAAVRAEETTALYDAVVHALYHFHGLRGQKALVLISDGRDTASTFTFDQAIEYARRSSVPIYAIGIGIRGNEMDVRMRLGRLTGETGGSVYYIEQARDLHRVYDEIQAELRSQYILGFYPSPDVKSGKWREVTVQVTEGKVKTVKGYFP